MEVDSIISDSVKIIRKHLGKEVKIFLFGSHTAKNARENSDIDISLLGKKKINFSEFVKIKTEVDEIPTLRKIDIVDLNVTSKKFREHVLSYAKQL